ncbi:Vacuolar protein sorting-associated protein 20 [Rhizoclosmatium sp. JEL0117]|nr:Vacuolar protein sorting-associated protein 20 [Rhizoclosmatium sp. JEL0117]
MGTSSSQPKPPKVTAHDRAILDLKVQRDKLKKYQKKLAQVAAQETEVAKHHLKNNDKKRALIALKKKKYQESLMEQTDMQLLNLEQMCETIEFTLIERDMLEGLKKGNAVLAEIHKEMNVDAVQQLMDDTADAIAYQNEIDELLGAKLNEGDMEDIEEELDALVAAEQFESMPQIPVNTLPSTNIALDLPDVPTFEPTTVTAQTKIKVKGKTRAEETLVAE